MCYTNSTHETPFKTSITSSTTYGTPLLAELGDKVSVQRPCDTRHHKRNTWHLAIWHGKVNSQNSHVAWNTKTPPQLFFAHKKNMWNLNDAFVWRQFFLGGKRCFFGLKFRWFFYHKGCRKKMHACQVHQCLHGQIRLQQSDPLQAHTHCATKSLACAVKPTKRPLLSGACGIMTLQKLRSQIPITPENMQEERNLISLCKSTVGKVAACLFYGIFFDFFGRHLQ